MPEAAGEFELIQGHGFVVYVHRAVVADAPMPGAIRFNFGRFGDCSVMIEGRSRDP